MIGGFSMVSLLLVFLAGVGAGFVGYAVGASSLVSYPALLAFGIPPVLANATNTVGVVGTGFGGALGARVELKGQRPRVIAYIAIGVVGGVLGALLLLGFDPTIFEHAVPPLILMSTLLIAVNPRGRMEARQAARDVLERTASGHAVSSGTSRTQAKKQIQPMSKDPWWLWIAVSFCGMYSGYFGAGAGTLVLHLPRRGGVARRHRHVRGMLPRQLHRAAHHAQDSREDHAHRRGRRRSDPDCRPCGEGVSVTPCCDVLPAVRATSPTGLTRPGFHSASA